MFSKILQDLEMNIFPEPKILEKLFHVAIIKKMGVLKLPPSFWMVDPKINPRADHLFWMALFLDNTESLELALSVLATEHSENKIPDDYNSKNFQMMLQKLTNDLLQRIPNPTSRQLFACQFNKKMTGLTHNGESSR